MLGYRHAFHAGNHADVLKHVTLLQVLDHLTGKDKPFWYIDTHAGAGLLRACRMATAAGHARTSSTAWKSVCEQRARSLEALARLCRVACATLNPRGQLQRYPGSPWIARARMRPARDHLWLHELHPTDHTHCSHAGFRHRPTCPCACSTTTASPH
jgi:23S rRNA (adenine2030-N6)-methyltransferase